MQLTWNVITKYLQPLESVLYMLVCFSGTAMQILLRGRFEEDTSMVPLCWAQPANSNGTG